MARKATKPETTEKETKEINKEKEVKAEPAKKPVAKKAAATKVGKQIEKMANPAVDPDLESKEDKFHRIAPARVSKVLDSLRILGHCSNLSTYEYSEEEVDKMFNSIRKKLDFVEHNFREKLECNQEVDFKF